MKPIDSHTHLLNYEITPDSVYFGDREWDLETLSPILWAWHNASPVDDALEWLAGKLIGRDIDSDPLAKVFFTLLEDQHELFASMPCTPVIMALDFRDVPGSDFFRSVVMAHEIAEQVGGYLAAGLDMTRTMKPLGAAVYKVYPALWTISQHEEIARLSHENHKPIITHANQGGIGRSKRFNRPLQWWDALAKNPDAVLCLAHAIGYSESEWEIVERMALEFRFPDGSPRIYVDTAFCEGFKFERDAYFNRLRERLTGNAADGILWGTDWPLCTVYYSQEESMEAHRKALGDELWEIISSENPRRFLKLSA